VRVIVLELTPGAVAPPLEPLHLGMQIGAYLDQGTCLTPEAQATPPTVMPGVPGTGAGVTEASSDDRGVLCGVAERAEGSSSSTTAITATMARKVP
jgi:hypothetical protein